MTLIYLIVLNRCLESVFRFLIYLIVVFRFLTRSESVFRFLTWRLGAEMSRCCNSITEKKITNKLALIIKRKEERMK